MLLSCFAKKVTKEGNKGAGVAIPLPLAPQPANAPACWKLEEY